MTKLRRTHRTAIASMAAIVALALLTPASAPATGGGTSVPIQGKGTGTISFNTSTGDFTGEESGVSSHLGRYTLRLHGNGTRAADGTVTGSGAVTIVAANGDRLTGTFTLTGQGDTTRVVVTITGGTGRFANASGTFTVICIASAAPRQEGPVLVLEHECSMKGRISY